MDKQTESKCYADWRRREAYGVPATEEGTKAALERYEEFKRGWVYGMHYAIFLTEQEHKENKHIHKFYLFFADKLRGLMK